MGSTREARKTSVFSEAGQTMSRRVLVVDDSKSMQEIVSRLLRPIGFETTFAGNGVEALSLFFKHSFDLVLTDLEMPVMDGWNLARRIKEGSPNTPVVLMTGAGRESVLNLKRLERGTVDSVIFKPFGLDEFQRTVREALELRK